MGLRATSVVAPAAVGVLLGAAATPFAVRLGVAAPVGVAQGDAAEGDAAEGESARAPVTKRAPVAVTAASAAAEKTRACPDDMVLVEGTFCPTLRYLCHTGVDETQRCATAYQKGVPCAGEQDERRFCVDRYEWPNRRGAKPVVDVTWHDAKRMCAEKGKRLCRRSEWVLACEGPERVPFPWGFRRSPTPCNIDKTPRAYNPATLRDPEMRAAEVERLYQAHPSGEREGCRSHYGVFDMTGNVDEWTDNTLDNPATRYPSTLNGGWWGPVRNTCRLTTKAHKPSFRYYQIGFRCCQDTQDDVAVAPPRTWIDEAGSWKRSP